MRSWRTIRTSSVLALFASLFLCSGNLHAQVFSPGIRGGIAIPQLQGGNSPQSEGYTSRTAGNLSVFADREITPTLALQLDLMYAGQGGKKTGLQVIPALPELPTLPPGTNLYADFRNVAIMDYLDLSVLGKLSTGLRGSLRGYLAAGPYLGYLLSAKTHSSGTSLLYVDPAGTIPLTIQGQPLPAQDLSGDTSITGDIKRWDTGLIAGVGLERGLGSGRLVLDLRGAYGLTDIQRDPANGQNNTGALILSLGYQLNR